MQVQEIVPALVVGTAVAMTEETVVTIASLQKESGSKQTAPTHDHPHLHCL
jgi:hypothetical protein